MKNIGVGTVAAGTALLVAAGAASAGEARQETFGELEGQPVAAVVLSNSHGMKARIIAYGATLQELDVPDRNGHLDDVVLSYPDMAGFIARPQYFGATVGRFANRIAKGTFMLDGQRYMLGINNGENSLHGGLKGFDKVLWQLSDAHGGPEASATFTYVSPDGDQGYPGELTAKVTFVLNEHNELITRYSATTTKPTVVNITNHSYFNLAGASSGLSILGEKLTIHAHQYTPTNAGLIPTGELRPVAGTDFDFRTPRLIGDRVRDGAEPQLAMARGYDHNFVLDGGTTEKPKLAVRLEDPRTGRVLELLTTEPGVQFYSGNFLDGSNVGKQHTLYRTGDALCLEPQRFPDSPNQAGFPSARLDPGQTYHHESIYRFSVAKASGAGA